MELFTNIAFFAAAQGIFLSIVLLFIKRGNKKANIFLAILIGIFSLWIAEFAAYFTEYLYEYPHLLFSTVGLPLLFGPLLFFYTKALKGDYFFTNKWNWLHFLPFILHTIYYLPFFIQPADEKIFTLRALQNLDHPPEFSLYFYVNESLKFSHLVIYLWLVRKLSIKWRFEHSPKNKFTPLYINWIQKLSWGLALFAIFDLSHLLSIWLFQYDYLFFIARGVLLSGGIVIYYIGYSTLRQPEIINGIIFPSKNVSVYQKSSLTKTKAQQYVNQLIDKMKNEKLYLNPDLKLQHLADALDTNTHHISQVLNMHLQKNFYDFVNEYRIKAAQEMLQETQHSHLTILAIAHEVGFNNKASFNTAFKKFIDMTPSAYRKTIKQRSQK